MPWPSPRQPLGSPHMEPAHCDPEEEQWQEPRSVQPTSWPGSSHQWLGSWLCKYHRYEVDAVAKPPLVLLLLVDLSSSAASAQLAGSTLKTMQLTWLQKLETLQRVWSQGLIQHSQIEILKIQINVNLPLNGTLNQTIHECVAVAQHGTKYLQTSDTLKSQQR